MNNSHQLSKISRTLIAIASLLIIGVFFLPAWRIDLFAPQYPEGLMMNIWINRLSGDVDIINGLNHYIGMKPFGNESFPEFKYLYLIVIFFILFGLLIAITGRSRLLLYYLIVSVIGGCMAMYDFYQWGYEYGHNLDPKAAIQVPGLSYQPPVFGHKRLLNFDAYSFPDSGGWLVIGCIFISFIVYILEFLQYRKLVKISMTSKLGSILIVLISFISCTQGPEPIVVGKDACNHCKMTIVDSKFACELITKQFKVYKFDDLSCLKAMFQDKRDVTSGAQLFVMDYLHNGRLLTKNQASLYSSPSFRGPMGGNIIAIEQNITAANSNGLDLSNNVSWDQFIQ